MGLRDIWNKATGADEEYEDTDNRPRAEEGGYEFSNGSLPRTAASGNAQYMTVTATTQLKIVVVKPTSFNEAAQIVNHLRNKYSVSINFEQTSKDLTNRILDFVAGAAYMADGKLSQTSNHTYMILPQNAEITNETINDLTGYSAFSDY